MHLEMILKSVSYFGDQAFLSTYKNVKGTSYKFICKSMLIKICLPQ